MKGFRARLDEFWNGTIEEVSKPTAKIVKSEFVRERPEDVTFERLMRYHDATPQIQIAVSSYSELITGTDMVVTTEDQKAKDFLDEWIRRTGFYDKFEGLVQTLLITGNALLEKLDKQNIEDVEEVDMTTIMAKKRTDVGELEWYEQRQQMGKIVQLKDVDKFIEFNLTHYSKQAWGRSLFYPLAIPRTTGFRTTAPLVEVLWGIEDAFAGIITNNAYPITTITYPGANDEYLEKEAERWRRYKPGDKRVQKIKPEIEFFETLAQSKYTDYVTHMEKVVELGTQFPHDILTGDFTSRASSETTETIVMKKVRGFQRYLSNKLKTKLFNIILEQNGFNPEEVHLEISFTAQNVVELEPDQVAKLFTDGVISLKEVRDWFAANVGMELDDKEMDDLLTQKNLDLQATQQPNERQERIELLKEKLRLKEEESNKKDMTRLIKQTLKEIEKL